MRSLAGEVEEVEDEGEGSGLVRVYPPEERERDDLRELLAEVDEHFGALDRAIFDAGNYRIFFLTVGFLRDATMPGYTFVMEWEPGTGQWAVGYKRKRRRGRWSRLKDVLVHDAKLDVAVSTLLEVWRGWAEEERAGRGEG
jgi:hypothetical protein